MADSGAVDTALTAVLIADAALLALMPDGVYFDMARKGATKFVLVELKSHFDDYKFGSALLEDAEYQVSAWHGPTTTGDLNLSSAVVKQAAARIHTLLQDATLTPTGYNLMRIHRVERIRFSEPDDDNPDARWHMAGGRYAVMVSPS